MKLIYITSPSYSGSTLLTLLLSKHEDIATIGELKGTSMGNAESYRCSCGELINDCEFWHSLWSRLDNVGVNFDVSDFRTNNYSENRLYNRILRAHVMSPLKENLRDLAVRVLPGCKPDLASFVERNRQIMTAVTSIAGASHFLDGSKDPIRLRHFLSNFKSSVKVIRLLRDGRGVTRSFMKNDQMSIESAARSWARAVDEVERVYAMTPECDRISIRYEELCAFPETVMGELWRFIGVSACDVLDRLHDSGAHILGNRMRLLPNVTIRLDEKWRSELSEADLQLFKKISGRRNKRLGY